MLTRIEVDGFKNLLGFSADFGPFTCIAGPNAVGKSNLFDVIEFLSLLADMPLEDAAQHVRSNSGQGSSSALFWTGPDGRATKMSLAVEMLVPNFLLHELGVEVRPGSVYLRYELELGDDGGLRLDGERLIARGGSLSSHLRFPHPQGFVELYDADADIRLGADEVVFDLANRSLPGGSKAAFKLGNATRTMLGRYANHEHPLVLAAHQELKSWRKLNLDPDVLRRPAKLGPRRANRERGSLAAQLRTLLDRGYYPEELSAQLALRLTGLTSVRGVSLREDEASGLLTIEARLVNGERVKGRELSDGTLRYLALAMLEFEEDDSLVVCLEEPENGLHPRMLGDLYELLRELALDPSAFNAQPSPEEIEEPPPPLRQLLISTHSSELVSEVYEHDPGSLLMASSILTKGPGDQPARVLRLHPIADSWRCTQGSRGVVLPVIDYVGRAVRPAGRASAAEEGP